jgi:hypothetical protein
VLSGRFREHAGREVHSVQPSEAGLGEGNPEQACSHSDVENVRVGAETLADDDRDGSR